MFAHCTGIERPGGGGLKAMMDSSALLRSLGGLLVRTGAPAMADPLESDRSMVFLLSLQ